MESKPRVVLITGCSSGIGLHLTKIFLSKGWIVFAVSRKPESLNFEKNENLFLRRMDITSKDDIQNIVNEIINLFGKIDLLINNAGYGCVGVLENTSNIEIEKQFNTNLFGTINLTRSVLPHMRSANKGKIIFVSSIVGMVGIPGFSPYVSSKFALEGFVESLQYELKRFKITLNLVLPGSVKTNFFSNLKVSKNNFSDYNDFQMKLENWNGGLIKTDPKVVAKRIYKISRWRKNKLRKCVTFDAKIIYFFKWLLPNRLFFSIVNLFFKSKMNNEKK